MTTRDSKSSSSFSSPCADQRPEDPWIEPLKKLRWLADDLNRGCLIGNLAEQIMDECDAIHRAREATEAQHRQQLAAKDEEITGLKRVPEVVVNDQPILLFRSWQELLAEYVRLSGINAEHYRRAETAERERDEARAALRHHQEQENESRVAPLKAGSDGQDLPHPA